MFLLLILHLRTGNISRCKYVTKGSLESTQLWTSSVSSWWNFSQQSLSKQYNNILFYKSTVDAPSTAQQMECPNRLKLGFPRASQQVHQRGRTVGISTIFWSSVTKRTQTRVTVITRGWGDSLHICQKYTLDCRPMSAETQAGKDRCSRNQCRSRMSSLSTRLTSRKVCS